MSTSSARSNEQGRIELDDKIIVAPSGWNFLDNQITVESNFVFSIVATNIPHT